MTETHDYLSTACFHGEHDYCAAMTGMQGAKRPAQCKFCGANCRCACHHGVNRSSARLQMGEETEAIRNLMARSSFGCPRKPISCGHMLVDHAEDADGEHTGPCLVGGCDCGGLWLADAASRRDIPGPPDDPAEIQRRIDTLRETT